MHILWLIMGILGAIWIFWDTRKQGYSVESSIRWAVGTFFVPAAVIPFYLLQSNFRSKYNNQQQRSKPQDVTSDMQVRCIHCGKFYQGNPEKCPHCKTVLKDE